MKVNVYAIYDSKAAAYLRPFFAQNHNVAFRDIERAMRGPQSPFADFPGDFSLFQLATFDDVSGRLEPLKAPDNLGILLQFVASQDNSPAAQTA